jgi:hypothetical protein
MYPTLSRRQASTIGSVNYTIGDTFGKGRVTDSFEANVIKAARFLSLPRGKSVIFFSLCTPKNLLSNTNIIKHTQRKRRINGEQASRNGRHKRETCFYDSSGPSLSPTRGSDSCGIVPSTSPSRSISAR